MDHIYLLIFNENTSTLAHYSFALYTEQVEATYAIFEPGVSAILRKYEKAIEYVHISDQYSGPKPPEYVTLYFFL